MTTLTVVALTVFATLSFLVIVALSVAVVYLLKKQYQRNEFKKAVGYTGLGAYATTLTAYIGNLLFMIYSDDVKNAVATAREEAEAKKEVMEIFNKLGK